MRRRVRRGIDLDITPLIDILFMLIIFFVLTATFVQGRMEVELPRGDGEPQRESQTLLVSVTSGGTIRWGGETVLSEDLPVLAERAVAESRDILLAGDRAAPYGVVAELLNVLSQKGLTSVGLALEGTPAP
ncbi:MAG: biopolymer transporter ExbD [Fretibacterium sp.]|nr:biopolymer transporter ExbD [Fretibacterium sp.]